MVENFLETIKKQEIIQTYQMPLEEWLDLVFDPPEGKRFIDVRFPSDTHLEEYLSTIDQRSEEEVYKLLEKFLIPTGTLESDQLNLEFLRSDQGASSETFKRKIKNRYYRRLILYTSEKSQIPPWEGITWILDLLPHFPKKALEGLYAYILAHAQILSDNRYAGLHDAAVIIRAKFIGIPGTKEEVIQYSLLDLSPRDFEHLVERLYHHMDYETELTPAQKDGGRDIIARKNAPGSLDHLRIECKRYNGPVGVSLVRSLLGVVSDEKVNKGVLVATSRFTEPAQKFAEHNPRLELISGEQLVILMNEHLGPHWPLHIESYIMDSQRQQQKILNSK
jgi:restriction system protein